MFKQFLIQKLFPLVAILVFIILFICFFFLHQFERNNFIYFILNSIVSIFCAYVAIIGIALSIEVNRKEEEKKKEEEAILQVETLLNNSTDLFFNTHNMANIELALNLSPYKINTGVIQSVLCSGVFVRCCPRGLMHLIHDILNRAAFLNLFVDTAVQDFLAEKKYLPKNLTKDKELDMLKDKLTKSPKEEIETLYIKVLGLHLSLKIFIVDYDLKKLAPKEGIFKLIAEASASDKSEVKETFKILIDEFNKTNFTGQTFLTFVETVKGKLLPYKLPSLT